MGKEKEITTTKSDGYYKKWIDKLKDQKDNDYQPQKLVNFVESLNREIEKQATEIEFFRKNDNDVYITIEKGVGKNYKNIYWGRMLLKNNIGVYNAVHVMPYIIYTDQYSVHNLKIRSTQHASKDDLMDNETYNIHKEQFNGFQFVLVTDAIMKVGQKCPHNMCSTCKDKAYCNGFVKKSAGFGPGIVFRNGDIALNSICYSCKIPSDAYEIDNDGYVVSKRKAVDFLNEYVKTLYSLRNQELERYMLPRRIDDVQEFMNTYCRRMELFDKEYKLTDKNYGKRDKTILLVLLISVLVFLTLIICLLVFGDCFLDKSTYILYVFIGMMLFYIWRRSKSTLSSNYNEIIFFKSQCVLEDYGADLSNNTTLQLLIDVASKKIALDYGALDVINLIVPLALTLLFDHFCLGFSMTTYYILIYFTCMWLILYIGKDVIFEKIHARHKQYRILIDTCQKRIWKNEMNKNS